MAASETISITLPPDLLTQAESIARREHRTVSELVGEALRTYASERQFQDAEKWRQLLEYGHAHGQAMGIHSEGDVDRILGEFRTPGLG